jgi:hypothetical protein
MYSREEAARIRQQFWISFGKYMKPVPSASGLPVNWVNYKTGVKHLFFRLDADNRKASVSIQLHHPDEGIRHLYFNQFEELKMMLHDMLGEEWVWNQDIANDYGKVISTISLTLDPVHLYNKEHWPQLIAFFKSRIIILDEFWDNVKPIFDALA